MSQNSKTKLSSASTKPKVRKESSKALVPLQAGASSSSGASQKAGKSLTKLNYKKKVVQPAANYDVVSFARAMNDNFGPRVKKLFDPEREAALEAQRTGIYIGWRGPGYKHDCQRVGPGSKCFCGHLLNEHDKYTGTSVRVPCKAGCKCKAFAFVPSRPEEVGEFWFQRRANFDPSEWRAKCRCKHSHEHHNPTGLRPCTMKSCGCGAFDSNFLCAACDKHWEQHETFFENEAMRLEGGLPVGENYLPFAEIPALRNMALTGVDNMDMSYMSAIEPPDFSRMPLPSSQPAADNNSVVPFGGRGSNSGFRPVYD